MTFRPNCFDKALLPSILQIRGDVDNFVPQQARHLPGGDQAGSADAPVPGVHGGDWQRRTGVRVHRQQVRFVTHNVLDSSFCTPARSIIRSCKNNAETRGTPGSYRRRAAEVCPGIQSTPLRPTTSSRCASSSASSAFWLINTDEYG